MGIFRYFVWVLVLVPTAVGASILYLSPESILEEPLLDKSQMLSIIGTALGYYSLLFSLYAALQVQVLSDKYFFRIRSPELHRKLQRISKCISEFGNEPADQLQSQKFISEAPVALRSARRVRNKHVAKVAIQAQAYLKKMKSNMTSAGNKSAGQVAYYWDFYQKISELVDELSEQLKDAKAKS